MTRKAVILFNLGGPDSSEAVQPFLFNLFNDPAIIAVPNPMRYFLAKLISSRRAPKAQGIYAELGGKSPILENTKEQAEALQAALGSNHKTFICMRYWHPMSDEVAKQVKAYNPDEIILLPLYPQFSTTTTGSSVKDWQRAASAAQLNVPTRIVGCYPIQKDFITAQAKLIRQAYEKASAQGTPRVLFSAHGLPEKIIAKGDPYQWQVEQTTLKVVEELDIYGLDFVNCYQSRVGPLKWIGPSTENELLRAKDDNVPIVLVPIAFVSEHSETLVELDIEYCHLVGDAPYFRVPTVSIESAFIEGLKQLCLNEPPARICPKEWTKCPCKA
ncbi:MAG: ferrochelatase [Alphaproteobacteria bacterium]|nr:ferrochelatase [Alphaproteobacteria bacterium]